MLFDIFDVLCISAAIFLANLAWEISCTIWTIARYYYSMMRTQQHVGNRLEESLNELCQKLDGFKKEQPMQSPDWITIGKALFSMVTEDKTKATSRTSFCDSERKASQISRKTVNRKMDENNARSKMESDLDNPLHEESY